jgi:hypothetical protein
MAPAITFAFLFAFLLVNVQRRLDRAVKTASGLMKKPPGPFDYLDENGHGELAIPSDDGDPRRGLFRS